MRPWIGPHYKETRCLIVGESAYDDPRTNYRVNQDTNSEIINDEIKGNRHKTQQQIAKIVGKDRASIDFWNSVAFYNFVQTGLPGRKDRSRIHEALPRSKAAFSELVGLSGQPFIHPSPRPTHIIAVGVSITWEEMPACEYDARAWAYALQGYKYPDGTIGLATAIVHPGYPRKYPYQKMLDRVEAFLRLEPHPDAVMQALSCPSTKTLFE